MFLWACMLLKLIKYLKNKTSHKNRSNSLKIKSKVEGWKREKEEVKTERAKNKGVEMARNCV